MRLPNRRDWCIIQHRTLEVILGPLLLNYAMMHIVFKFFITVYSHTLAVIIPDHDQLLRIQGVS